MEEVLFETETAKSRQDVAEYLRTVADRLESGGNLALSAGDQSVEMAVPERPTFEVKAERETESGGTELSVEFELEWTEGESGSGGGDLQIE